MSDQWGMELTHTCLEYLDHGISVVDADFNLEFVNLKFLEILDLPPSLLVAGKTRLEDVFRYNAERGEYGPGDIEEQVAERMELAALRLPHDFERTRPDGCIIRVVGNPLPNGGFVTTYSDVTELAQSREQLKETNNKLDERVRQRTLELAERRIEISEKATTLETVVQNVNAGLGLFDNNLRLTLWNDLFFEIVGFPHNLRKKGTPIEDFIMHVMTHDTIGEDFSEAVLEKLITNVRNFTPFHQVRKQVDGRYLEVTRQPTPAGMLVTFVDVTDQKEAELVLRQNTQKLEEMVEERTSELRIAKEIAENASKTKSQFLAAMSHELRTPLNAIMGYSEILEEESIEMGYEELIEDTRRVYAAAKHLLSLINEVLDISKIEAGKLTLEEEAFDLSRMIETLLDMVGSKAQEKKLVMQSFIDDDAPHLMVGDSIRLRQILMNFLTNAIKFTDHGHVLLRVVVVRHLQSAVHLRFSVEDSGIGIRADRAMTLFDEYVLGHDQLSTAAGGTGLGLSICKRLAELMGGQVGVVSTPGIGSNFWFDITLSVATCNAPEPVEEQAARGHTLWICDDLQVNRTLLISIARKLGMTTREFTSGDDMLPHLMRESPSMIVISHSVWGKATDEFRLYVKNHPTRVAMSSPDVLTHDGEELLAQGIHAYWDWPISQHTLSDLLVRLLQQPPTSDHLVTRYSRAPASPRSSMTANQPVPELAGARVLLVEDNPVNQRVTGQMLSRLGCVVSTANNGQESVTQVQEQDFDLVLMDCHMPVMDGLAASRAIRAWEQKTGARPLSIVALSADVMSDRKTECEEAGMDGYLSKPIRLHELKRELPEFVHLRDVPSDSDKP